MAGNSNVVQIKFEGIANFNNVLNNIKSVRSALQNIKMPEKLSNSLEKNINQTITSIEKLQAQSKKGFSKPGDVSAYEKELNKADIAINRIVKDLSSLSSKELIDLNIDTTKITQLKQQIKDIKTQLTTNVKGAMLDPSTGLKSSFSGMDQILNKGTRAKAIYDQLVNSINKGNFSQANTEWEKLQSHMERYSKGKMDTSQWKTFQTAIVSAFAAAGIEVDKLTPKLEKADQELNDALNVESSNAASYMQRLENGVQGTAAGFGVLANKERQAANEMLTMNQQMNQLKTQANYFFGLQNMFQLLKRGVRDAVETIKELDASMTETAVVTEFSVADMWEMLPTYTEAANELGSTINDVYQAATLYYQQGLDTNQAMGLANETLKMARIGGLEAAQATDMMTAALRGFNMEINEVSGQRINDVYSNLAAKTASNTRELGDAMTRTASIAHSANMTFEMTSAFLANMIETTREAPENLGTAMKTIIARFQEMKKNPNEIVDVEGEEVSFNRVDTALKSIGVELTKNKNEFRDLDEVFMDISEKWGSLTQTQQRYIATISAGSRQQSRFIAMVGNYERMQELATYANEAAGASQVQFEKTLDSLQAKLNQFKNAWDRFLMSIANNVLVKTITDVLTKSVEGINTIINSVSKLTGPFKGVTKSVLSLTAAFTGLKLAGKFINSSLGLLGKAIDPTTKIGFAGGLTGRRAESNAAQAKAINQPIVQRLDRILSTMKARPNFQSGERLNQNDFIKANNKVRDILAGNPTQQIGGKFKSSKDAFTFGSVATAMKGMDTAQQTLVAKNNPFLKTQLKTSVFDMFAGNGKLSARDKLKYKGWSSSLMKYAQTPGTGLELTDLMTANKKSSQRKIAKTLSQIDPELQKQYEKSTEAFYNKMAKNKKFSHMGEEQLLAKAQETAAGKMASQLGLSTSAITDPKQVTATVKFAQGLGLVGQKATGAGMALQGMGQALSQMGLQTLGSVVSGVGTAFMSLGTAVSGVGQVISKIGIAQFGAISAAVVGIIFLITKWNNLQKKIKEDAQEVADTYKKTESTTKKNLSKLEDYRTEYARLARGVDKNNQNVGLGAEEYQDYITMTNEIAKMSPELVQGWNSEGNAILDRNKAVEEAIKLQKKLQKEAHDEYTSMEALQKTYTAMQLDSNYKMGQGTAGSNKTSGGNYVGGAQGTSERDSKLKKQAWDIIDQINEAGGHDILVDFEIDAQSAEDLTDQEAAILEKHGATINARVKDEIKDVDEKQLSDINDSVADYGRQWDKYRESYSELLNQLQVKASDLGYFEDIEEGFRGQLNEVIERVASDNTLNVEEKWAEIENFHSKLVTLDFNDVKGLTDFDEKYKDALTGVKIAQEDFERGLIDSKGYEEATGIWIDQLRTWAAAAEAEWQRTGETQYQLLYEMLNRQVAEFDNFDKEATFPTLEESLNTLSDEFASAQAAYESFSKAIESGDFYTAAEGMSKIFEEINDHADASGAGSRGFWKASEALLSDTEYKKFHEARWEQGSQQAYDRMKQINEYFKEGVEGYNNWMDHLKGLDFKELGIDQYISKDKNGEIQFTMDEISSDEFHQIAEALQLSDDAFAGLLSKAQQYQEIDFSSSEQLTQAMDNDENVKKITEDNGKTRYVMTRDYLSTAEENAQQELSDKALKDNNITILEPFAEYVGKHGADVYDKNVKEVNKEVKKGTKQWMIDVGIGGNKTSTEKFIHEAVTAGVSQEESKKAYDAAIASGLITDKNAGDELYSQTYNAELEAQENPVQSDIKTEVTKIADDVSQVAKLLAIDNGRILEEQKGQGKEAWKALIGEKGVSDTWEQQFAKGKNVEGEDLTDKEYKDLKEKLQAEQDRADSEIETLTRQRDAAKAQGHDADAKALKKEIDDWTKVRDETKELQDKGIEIHTEKEEEKKQTQQEQKERETNLQTAVENSGIDFSEKEQDIILNTKLNTSEDVTKFLETMSTDKNREEVFEIAAQLSYSDGDVESFIKNYDGKLSDEQIRKISFVVDNADANGLIESTDKKLQDAINRGKENAIKMRVDEGAFTKAKKAFETIKEKADVAATPRKFSITATDNATGLIDKINRKKLTDKVLNIKGLLTGLSEKVKKKLGLTARGRNNYIPHQSIPTIGSLASGNARKFNHGTVGPNNTGGLTLTGEKGFEIAWLPSENRSMILGANGPQLIDLPSDAVVWTNEQSKKIIKQKAIPAGSHANNNAESTGRRNNRDLIDGSSGKSGSSKSSSSKSSSNKNNSNKDKKSGKEKEKELIKRGKLSVYVYNMEKKIEEIERKIEKTQKNINKALEKASTTLKDITSDGNKYIKYLNKEVSLNKELFNYYKRQLNNLDKKGKKKKDKTTIEWTNDTKKTSKDDKTSKGSRKHKAKVNLGAYIKKDSSTGAYVIDQNAINKVAKKDKNKAKAIRDKAKEKIDKYTSGRNTAEDKWKDAEDKLAEFSKQLYDTFYGWENELTKVFNLTQQVTNLQQKREKANKLLEMRSALLSSGMRQASNEFIKESLDIYKAQLGIQLNEIKKREELITESKNKIEDLRTTRDEKEKLAQVKTRLSNGAAYAKKQNEVNKAQKKVDKANKTVKTYNANRKKAKEMKDDVLSTKTKKKLQNRVDKLEKKKKDGKLTKKEKQELKNAKAKLSADKKARNFLKKNSTKSLTKKNYQQAKKEVKDQKKLQKQKKKAEAVIAKLSKKKNLTKAEKAELKKAKENLKNAKAGLAKNAKAQKIIDAYKAKQSKGDLNTQLEKAKKALNSAPGKLSATEEAALKEEQRQLEEQIKNINTAKKYIKTEVNPDGSINIDIDSKRLEDDKAAGNISEDLYNFIKQYYDDLEAANSDLTENYEAQLELVEQMASTLRDLQEAYADRSEELLQALEEQNQKEIDRLKKLSDALDNALKELLDEVKKRLEQRRQQEDNAKTEEDIAQKQQRLAALRADSSGGNAVKIKQLEKEIADAQQSYTRTLEDQTLQRMQDEADEAAKQRERQIELLEAQLEYQKATGILAAQVNEWLSKPDEYQDIITKVWMENQDVAEKTAARLETIKSDFKVFWSDISTDGLRAKIEWQSTKTEEAIQQLKWLELIKNTLIKMAGEEEKDKGKDNGNGSENPTGSGNPTGGGNPVTESSTKDLEDAAEKKNKAKQDYLQFLTNHGSKLSTSKKKGKLTKDDLKKQIERGKELGYSTRTVLQHLANQNMLSWATVLKAYISYRGSKSKAEKSIRDWWGKKPSAARKSGFKSAFGKAYAKGGLATSTGPAWLDGTKSKPELVLNAQDTKNFLALKDTLSKAVSGTSNIVGDTNMTYDIDINVDHITSDYDVDQIANRVQKKIVQSASYRNVNAIRNIR